MEISPSVNTAIQNTTPARPGGQTTPAQQQKDNAEPSTAGNSVNEQSSEDVRKLRLLQSRDREVRAHEQAHLTAAGRYATSGANLDFQRGPDGKLYAVGGDVSISTSPIAGDPRATLLKAEVIRRAALAPSTPSSQDRSVAAQAGRMAAKARQEIQQENQVRNGSQEDSSSRRNDLDVRIERSGARLAAEPSNLFDELV